VKAISFLIFLGANFVWLLLVVGGLMTWFMPRDKNRNTIILAASAVLALALTLAVVERGPDFDEGSGGCNSARGADSCN
jgi:hypothetical protein